MADTMKKNTTEKVKQNLHYQREKDAEPVKGIFRYHEVPGGTMGFCFRGHKGEPIKRYVMRDGEVYTVPLGVARHLNKDVSYPIHNHKKDEQGNVSQDIGEMVHRCSFQSLEFVDLEGVPTSAEAPTSSK